MRLPATKLRDLRQMLRRALLRDSLSTRELARLVGKLSACRPAIEQAALRLRPLEATKTRWLAQGPWDAVHPVTPQLRAALSWWADQLQQWNGRTLLPQAPALTLTTDASPTGLGARVGSDTTALPWNHQEESLHITARETLALYHSLRAFLQRPAMGSLVAGATPLNPAVLEWRTDSTVAMAVIRRQYSRSPVLDRIVQQIWDLLLSNNVRLLPVYLPSAEMIRSGVDELSRRRDSEAVALNRQTFHYLENRLGPFTCDAMADRATHQLPRYVARYPDAQAVGTDFFTTPASVLGEHPYLNPPWSLIPRVIQRLRFLRLQRVTLILPHWQNSPWWGAVLKHQVSRPLIFQPRHGFWLKAGKRPFPAARWATVAVTCSFAF